MDNENRVVFADYIRMVACLMVMLVHASEQFYGVGMESGMAGPTSFLCNEANRFWVAFFDGFVARTAVPLFMIVSAFLLVPLKDDMTMSEFYCRRFKRILPPFILFLVLYSTLPALWGWITPEQSIADLKTIPFNFTSLSGHLWFMYPLISLYLIIPVVSPWLKKASAKDERIFLGIFAVSTIIPWLHRYVSPEIWGECFWNGFTMLWYCSGYLGYLVLAHYIRVHLKWSDRKKLLVGAGCFLGGSLFSAAAFWIKAVPGVHLDTPSVEWAWEFCLPNIVISAAGAFLMFSCIKREKTPRIVRELSGLSFGMYLMHMFYLTMFSQLFIAGNIAEPPMPVYLTIPAIAICTYICSAVTTKLISFIPGSKWLVGYHSQLK